MGRKRKKTQEWWKDGKREGKRKIEKKENRKMKRQ